MKRSWLILAVFGVCMAVAFCGGCEEDSKVSDEPRVVAPQPEPVAADEATPKPVDRATPKPADRTRPRPATRDAATAARAAATKVAVDPNKAAKIVLDKATCDFGEVGGGSRKTIEVKITNSGKGVLNITRVDACCGCSPTISKKTVAVGESTVLKVSCSFTSRPGTMRRQIYVHSNDPLKPKAPISIKAKIVQKISFEPTLMKLYLDRENAGCPAITLKSLDGKAFAIRQIKATGGAITADFAPSVEAMQFVLEPKVDPNKLTTGLNGYIEIALTHPDVKSAAISFNALARYKLSPPQVILFNAEAGKPINRKIWVLNNYEEAFEIEATSSANGTIEVISDGDIKNGHEFDVKITPPKQQSNRTMFTDTFTVTIKGGPTLTVPCRGFYLRLR